VHNVIGVKISYHTLVMLLPYRVKVLTGIQFC